MNSLQTYKEAGQKAGKAMMRKDWNLASFQRQWLTKALALELPEHRKECRAAYEAAYREETLTK